MPRLTLGLDYGTNSVRGLLVDVDSGTEVGTAVFSYPSGEAGVLLDPKDPNLARQNPDDYVVGCIAVCQDLAAQCDLGQVIGVGVDTTGSSPMPIQADCQPLSRQFPNELAAMCWLWKDHTGHAEAAEITATAPKEYLAKCGGTYSSEWWWSKMLRCARVAPQVFDAAASWVEICDWIPAMLCGITDPAEIKRSRCAAGHKAMFEEEWGGLPSPDFLESLDPRLAAIRPRLYDTAYTSDEVAGHLCPEMATAMGLPAGIPVAVGAFDAHHGAVASGASPGTLVKIVGTSTCDCMVHPLSDPLPDIPGMCGIVRGSVLPGFYGLEAGQSAVGDIFNWVASFTGRSHEELNDAALMLQPGQSGLLALDWHNGNRTVLVDPLLSGLIVGLTLHSTPAEVYRACVEATAFGALRIIDRMEEYGVKIERVIACGGIADKSALTMQIYADVFSRPVMIARSHQTCALGAAIFASVAAGAHPDTLSAQKVMAGVRDDVYHPQSEAVSVYRDLYALYCELHDHFGLDKGSVMKKLIRIREVARG